MALLTAGEAAPLQGTKDQTQEGRAQSWKSWILFLEQIGVSNAPFIKHFDKPWCRTLLIVAFAKYMQEDSFSTQYLSSLAEGTVRTAVDHVAQKFRSNKPLDPRNNNRGRISYILQQQYKGYKNQDKNVKKQKPLPLIFLRELHKNKTTVKNIAIYQLYIGAIFFAVRSCEYLRTNIPEERQQTNTLRLCNIRFYVKGRQAPHYHFRLALSNTVTINFEFQKIDERHE